MGNAIIKITGTTPSGEVDAVYYQLIPEASVRDFVSRWSQSYLTVQCIGIVAAPSWLSKIVKDAADDARSTREDSGDE